MSLETIIKNKIEQNGPITVAEYMAFALAHPEHGYYMKQDPLGAAGDFITAPEISQIFGEMIGVWLAHTWQSMGSPQAALAELGPGRGTLMADILRATRTVPGFHDAITVHLVETSPALKNKQQQALAGKHPRMHWHLSVEELPDMPWLLIANEFFDALPIRQMALLDDRWEERRVLLENGKLVFSIPSSAPILECPFLAEELTRMIAGHISTRGGAALVIDYGYSGGGNGDTLQAVKSHHYHDVLTAPGDADLTAHVDFDALKDAALSVGATVYGPVSQGAFLSRMGASARAQTLCASATDDQKKTILSGLDRLLSPDAMGELFKVLCITNSAYQQPEAF